MRKHTDSTPGRTRSRVLQELSTPAAPTFEALEPRLLLSSSDLLMFGAGLAGDAWQGDMVAMSSAEPGGGPLAVHASLAEDGDGGDGAGSVGSVIIDGVPAYVWRYGCGPTAVGMIIGYWDSHGYPNFVEGSAEIQTSAVNAMIASTGHYEDYSKPVDNAGTGLLADKSSTGGAHDNNSVADWMYTSFSSRQNYYGWSWFSNIDDGFEGYAEYVGYAEADARNKTWGVFTWEAYVAEIDNDRPVGLIVDTNGDGWTDHFITGIGYDESTHQYAAYNTWDRSVHWYDFKQISSGQRWGVYGATFFDPGPSAVDAVAPAAELAAANVTAPGATTYTFTVTYSDNVAVDVSDIDSSDVRVTGPNGFSRYATVVGVDAAGDGTPRTATYQISTPGGTWDLTDNGTYTVALAAGQVSDTSGNLAPAGVLGTFEVAVADVTAPTAALIAANVTAPGASTYTFTVTYSDNVAVDVSDLDSSDVRVTGPNGFSRYATFVGADVASDGTPRTATYRITAPGDGWDLTDNGTYTVALAAGQVSDTAGNLAPAGVLGTFSVNVAQPEPEPEPEPEPDSQETTQKFGSFDGRTGVRLTLPGANGVAVTYSLKGSGYGQIEGDAGSE
ncbi:MAG: LEPR-XLL domain-containing protein, partial [Planctomycetota bacterium]